MAHDPTIEKEGTDPHPVMIRLQIEDDELPWGPSLFTGDWIGRGHSLVPGSCLIEDDELPRGPCLFAGDWIGRRHSLMPGSCLTTSNSSKLAGLFAQLRRKPPRHCDLFSKIGSVIINDDGSCAISSTLMCMASQVTMLIEMNGGDSVFLRVPENVVASIKLKCVETKVWTANFGAPSMEGVLDLICSWETGVPTVFDSISLILKSYKTLEAGKLGPEEVADMIQKQGPVVGTLWTDEYYLDSTVYPGAADKQTAINHAVVCSGYRFVDDELRIMIVDNHERGGPVRFVLHQAFTNFYVLTVATSKHVDIPKKFGCRMF